MKKNHKQAVKWLKVLIMTCVFTCMVMTQKTWADENVSIVLKYGDANYSTTVYGPEISNINSGVSVSTSTWIKEICNHVYSSSFNTIQINDGVVQQDVFSMIKSGSKSVSLDLKNYIKGSEKPVINNATVTPVVNETADPASAGSNVGMNAAIAANLNKIGIDTKISECTTKYVVGQDRSKNIIVAASRLNGLILQPGTGISVDTVILPRTTANGYGMGNAIMGDDFIKVVGGGICQLSSTLNTAVLRAGIIPTERHNHSQNVSYLASGLDATISSGKMDYQFVNTLMYPIYIEATTDNGILKVALYSSTKALNGVTYQAEVAGSKKKNTTYIVGYLNGIETGRIKAYSSSYK
ncbi:MAG: VanW family protein [bacterium]|nr:VanW family protein [bacterium]